MIKIRLARQGKGHNKFYKIVATEKRSKRNGEALEILGHWQPSSQLKNIDSKKINELVKKGAKLSKAVESLL